MAKRKSAGKRLPVKSSFLALYKIIQARCICHCVSYMRCVALCLSSPGSLQAVRAPIHIIPFVREIPPMLLSLPYRCRFGNKLSLLRLALRSSLALALGRLDIFIVVIIVVCGSLLALAFALRGCRGPFLFRGFDILVLCEVGFGVVFGLDVCVIWRRIVI